MPRRSIYKRTVAFHKHAPLIATEGLDGSGKTELVIALRDRLESCGRPIVTSNWNDTVEIYNLMMRLNAAGDLDDEMRCIFGATELAARYHYLVRPALDDGVTVLLTKYLVSAMAHARARGHSPPFVRRLYDFALEPDLTLYVEVPPDVALARKLRAGGIGFWEAGVDVALGLPIPEALRLYDEGRLDANFVSRCFLRFQARLSELHRELLDRSVVVFLDGTLPMAALVEQAVTAVVPMVLQAGCDARPQVIGGREEVLL